MRRWAFVLSGLIVWAAHFFVLYVAASLLPGAQAARWLTLIFTLVGMAAAGAILWRALRAADGPFERWTNQLAAIGAGLALIAVLWQGLPALLA